MITIFLRKIEKVTQIRLTDLISDVWVIILYYILIRIFLFTLFYYQRNRKKNFK